MHEDTECWAPTNDVHGFGGTSHSSTTLSQCKAACVDDKKCVAIDWQPTNAPNSCWILTSTVTGDTTQTGVITHYELNRDCPRELYFYDTESTCYVRNRLSNRLRCLL